MASFEIIGGNRLSGELVPQGSKNEALQILCAVLLTKEEVRVENVPNIRDVNKLIELLGFLGVRITKESADVYIFRAENINVDALHTAEFVKKATELRGSIMLVGPLLARL
ncbi:MAG: UDP-N-acetylglucosamine 1-carboxyvinyltransferase, partial [Paludibacteraceae bacterium]|nr:UDP-N-acetylglucosamine 1-carboxyvinyltransferase [Paludibacteraceae bacterium]